MRRESRWIRWLLVCCLGLLLPSVVAATDPPLCFPETGQCLQEPLRGYWERHGGLPVFGYPRTPAVRELNADTQQIYETQWFERNRLEVHPENQAPYDILLGRLGDDRLRQLGVDWAQLPRASGPEPGCMWFQETQHNVCDQLQTASGPLGFKQYWSSHGLEFDGQPGYAFAESLALFGLPLSEPRMETNSSGDTVLTQWFERARFEYHPHKPDEYKVLLGLLGNEILAHEPLPGAQGEIALLYENRLYSASPSGSRVRLLAENVAMRPQTYDRPRWSPDGTRITAHIQGNLFVVDAQTGQQTQITHMPPVDSTVFIEPDWSPDGRQLAFEYGAGLAVANADGSGLRHLLPDGVRASCPDWSPDGQQIAFALLDEHDEYQVAIVNVDGSMLRTLRAGVCPVWSPDGRQLAFSTSEAEQYNVFVIDAAGGTARNLTRNTDGSTIYHEPIWSPDGGWLLVGRYSSHTNQDLLLINLSNGAIRELAATISWEEDAAWSPSGRHVAFSLDGWVTLIDLHTWRTAPVARGSLPAWAP